MRYAALLTGNGDSCDNTIGCDEFFFSFKADNEEEAVIEIKNQIFGKYYEEDNYYDDGICNIGEGVTHRELSSVVFFKIEQETEIDIDKWYNEATSKIKKRQKELEKEERRKQFKKLKEEFKDE